VSVNEAKSLKRFVLRFVKAINPPSYSEGVKTGMSPSRGFYLVSPATSLSAKALITRTVDRAATLERIKHTDRCHSRKCDRRSGTNSLVDHLVPTFEASEAEKGKSDDRTGT
jgi:hypothetical protein